MSNPSESIQIRDARPDELTAVRELTLAAYEEYAAIMTPPAWAALKAVLPGALGSTLPAERIIAEQDSRLVGSVMLFPAEVDAYGSSAGQSAIPEIRMLAVPVAARGKGVGRALVEECIRRARQAGASELGLHTSISMQAAIHLYEDMGFARFPANDFQPDGAELVMAYRLRLTDHPDGET